MFVRTARPPALAAVSLVVLALSSAPAAAQDPTTDPVAASPGCLDPSITLGEEQLFNAQPLVIGSHRAPELRRPASLTALYASYIGMQALDTHSTLTGLSRGGAREANPAMKGIASSPAALIGVKAATTALVIYGSEKLRKRNRVAAVIMMAALNSVSAYIVAHNYQVAGTR